MSTKTETEKPKVQYDFAHKHNRFEINAAEGRALPLLVLSQSVYDGDGEVLKKRSALHG